MTVTQSTLPPGIAPPFLTADSSPPGIAQRFHQRRRVTDQHTQSQHCTSPWSLHICKSCLYECTSHCSSSLCFTLRRLTRTLSLSSPTLCVYSWLSRFFVSRSRLRVFPLSNKRPPWRSLLPLNTFIDGLLVVGKSAVFANFAFSDFASVHPPFSRERGQSFN